MLLLKSTLNKVINIILSEHIKMMEIGEKSNKKLLLESANNGTLKQENNKEESQKKRKINQFCLSLTVEQKEFIYKLVGITKLRPGHLIWQSILFVNNNPISLDFLNEYISFIYDKKHGTGTNIQKVMTTHQTLKEASTMYKNIGYNIGIKGVVLIYLLNYAKNHLKIDISKLKVPFEDIR
jgi:hypothetical protein